MANRYGKYRYRKQMFKWVTRTRRHKHKHKQDKDAVEPQKDTQDTYITHSKQMNKDPMKTQ